MITQNNPSLNSTAEAIFVSTANKDILEQCRIREDNIAHEKYHREQLELLTSENKALNNEIKTLSDEVSRLRKLLEENGIKSE